MADMFTDESNGLRPDEAFALLANDTRVAILHTLWEAYEPFGDDDAVPFTDLRERVGMRDPGQFHYHLDRLTGHFVRRTEMGYELRQAGLRVVQAVIAGTGIEDSSLAPVEIDESCPFCEAPIAISYEDETLYLLCTACEGAWGRRSDLPRGTITPHLFPPTGLSGRTPEEVLNADLIYSKHSRAMMVEGICPVCTGRVDTSLDICEDHDTSGGICESCGFIRRPVGYTCTVCKFRWQLPPELVVAMHPAVVGFHYKHGSSFDVGDYKDYLDVVRQLAWDEELVSDDPTEIRVTIAVGENELHLTLDEEMEVVDVRESN